MVRAQLEENLCKFTRVVRDTEALNLGVLNCKVGKRRRCSSCEMIVTERTDGVTWLDKEWIRQSARLRSVGVIL